MLWRNKWAIFKTISNEEKEMKLGQKVCKLAHLLRHVLLDLDLIVSSELDSVLRAEEHICYT